LKSRQRMVFSLSCNTFLFETRKSQLMRFPFMVNLSNFFWTLYSRRTSDGHSPVGLASSVNKNEFHWYTHDRDAIYRYPWCALCHWNSYWPTFLLSEEIDGWAFRWFLGGVLRFLKLPPWHTFVGLQCWTSKPNLGLLCRLWEPREAHSDAQARHQGWTERLWPYWGGSNGQCWCRSETFVGGQVLK